MNEEKEEGWKNRCTTCATPATARRRGNSRTRTESHFPRRAEASWKHVESARLFIFLAFFFCFYRVLLPSPRAQWKAGDNNCNNCKQRSASLSILRSSPPPFPSIRYSSNASIHGSFMFLFTPVIVVLVLRSPPSGMLSHRAWPHRLSPSPSVAASATRAFTAAVSRAASDESGIEPGPIATITGSVVSFAHSGDHLDHHYDTDHTDLTSEPDETEIRRTLLHDQWRQFFDRFDPEGFGEIPWCDFVDAIASEEFRERVNTGKREVLLAKARSATTHAITFQDFVNIMTGKRSRSFKCAVHHRDREVSSENDFHLLLVEPPIFRRMVRIIADEFLTDERDRKYYADHYSCCPPPLFIITVTLVELGFFVYYSVSTGELNPAGPVPIDSVLIYRPDKRLEIWRFLLYMLLHAGWLHLGFNLVVQLLVGLPLEMVHGSGRVALIYMAGVVAGSLGTSVFDTDVYLVGASGGVYALLAAHLANVLLNYNNMQCGILRLFGIFAIASCDVGYAIYSRYATETMGPPVSYVAHLTGALAGLTIGLLVLKNFEQKLHEQLLWWVALGVYAACTIFAVLFNVMNPVAAGSENLGDGVNSQYVFNRFGV